MQLLDVTQLSGVLNIKIKTIYDWVHKGQIPYIKLGHLLRFDSKDIDMWLRKRKKKTSETLRVI